MNLIKEILKNKTSKFVILSFIPVAVSTIIVFINDIEDIMWLRMGWNYFLAVIPVYMALFASHFSEEGKKIIKLVFMFLWLIFFPNSIYMITDYKYLSEFNFELWDVFTEVGANISPWLLVSNLVISITLGILVGLMSLEIIHNILKKEYSNKICWGIITGISLLSSLGVYIGRFARLNSWDIINPIKIVVKTFDVMTPFAPIYILIFTILTLVLYIGYRYFIYHTKNLT